MARVADLPDADEPLITANGAVAPRSANSRTTIEVPTNKQAVAIISGTRRKLSDIPVAPKTLNAIALICIYTLYGLESQEISIVTGIPVEQIARIRMTAEYADIQKQTVTAVTNFETEDVREFIAKGSKQAAKRVYQIMEAADSDKVALAAAKDILDRSGHRPADVVEIHNRMNMDLRIEVVDKTGAASKQIDGVSVEVL